MANNAKAVVMSFFDAANQGDMDTCTGLFADDMVWTDMGSTRFSGRYEGKDKVLSELMGPLFSQLQAGIYSEITNVICEGDQVVVLSKGKAKTLAGENYENDYCQIFTVSDGKISAVVEYCDTALVNAVFGSGSDH